MIAAKDYNRRNKLNFAGLLFLSLFIGSVLLIKPLHVFFAHQHDHTCTAHTGQTTDGGNHNCEICTFHFNPFVADNLAIKLDSQEILLAEFVPFYPVTLSIADEDFALLRAPPVFWL